MDQKLVTALKGRRKKYTFVSITDKLKKPTECHKIQRLFLFFIISSLQMKCNPILVTKVYIAFQGIQYFPFCGEHGVPFFTEIRRIPITTENVRRGEIERNGIVCP